MLSERERRSFQQIEQQTLREDPRFARSMRRLHAGASKRRSLLVYDVLSVLAVLSAVLCAALWLPGPALVAVGVAGLVRCCRPGPPPRLPRLSRPRRSRSPEA